MKYVIELISILFLLACKNEPVKSAYFEGYVDYKVESIALDNSEQSKVFVRFTGITSRSYYKNGNYMMSSFDSNGNVTIKFIYEKSSGRLISVINKNLYYHYSLQKENERKAKNWRVIDSNLSISILGKKCFGYSSFHTVADADPYSLKQTFYCSTEFPVKYVKPDNNNPNYLYYSQKFSLVPLKSIIEIVGRAKVIQTATHIVPTPLSDTFFTVPTDKPLIHF